MPPKKRAKTAQNDPWGDQPASHGPWDQGDEDDPWRFVCCDRAADVPGVSVVSGVPDDGVDPWHTEKQDKRDRTINLEAAMQMTVSMSCGKATTSDYDANAANPSRIRAVVGGPCKRKSCKKPGCQKGGLNFTACSKFLDAWASLTLMERSHLLRCCYQENCSRQDESGVSGVPGVQWNICGQSVCFQRFCEVLGSSQRTIRRMAAGQPDLRTAVGGKLQPRLALQTLKCDHFFRNLHASAAEPMPEEAQMYPKARVPAASGVSGGVSGVSAGIVKKRNMQQIDAWEHWSYDWLQTPPSDVMSSEMVIGPLGLPIRYIQHQRLSDLYWQFLAEWEVHVERNPSEGTCPCFNTFSKRYLSHWKHVLVMRKVSQHGQCKLCFDLHQILQNTKVDWATKVTWSFISQQTAFGKHVFQCTVSCSQLQNQQLR